MKSRTGKIILMAILAVAAGTTNCAGGDSGTAVRQNSGYTVAQATAANDQQFTVDGSGKEFQDARINAYVNLIQKAIVSLIGDAGYQANQDAIQKSFFSYIVARKYVLGDVDPAPGKEKKWVSQTRDDSGNLVLKLQAYVNIQKLKTDLDAMGASAATPQKSGGSGNLNSGGTVTTATSTFTSDNTGSKTVDTLNTTSSTGSNAAVDTSAVDLSSLTFVVFYDPKNFKADEDAQYAKWGVDAMNKQLANIGVQTFDLDTMEKLAEEKKLQQEADTGSVSVGQLLAQNLYAELYAEVVPAVTYVGDKAQVFMKVKVYNRTTGALIATVERGGARGGSISANVSASIRMDMRIACSNSVKEIADNLKKYVSGGRFYNVSLTGVQSYRDASKFSTTISKMDGVKNVTLKSGSKEDATYNYTVQYNGNPTQLVDKLFEYLGDKPGYEKFDMKQVRGNDLTFTLE
jgi:hypothetical protein